MLSPYLKRITIDVFLFIAFGLGLFYAYKVFLDFLISLFHYDGSIGTVNFSSMAYCVQRVLYILIPLIMLTVINKFSKMKIFKFVFYAIGICYLLGNSWLIYYVINNSPINLIYGSIPKWFANGEFGEIVINSWNDLVAFQFNNVLVFNYLIWDSYDLFGVIFSTVQGILYIRLARNLDTTRWKVMRSLILISVLSLILPWLYNIVVRARWIFTGDWANRNILILFESFFIIFALNIAASSRSFWHDVLW